MVNSIDCTKNMKNIWLCSARNVFSLHFKINSKYPCYYDPDNPQDVFREYKVGEMRRQSYYYQKVRIYSVYILSPNMKMPSNHSQQKYTWSESPANFKGSNNRTTIRVEGDLKMHKSFVLGLLIFKPVLPKRFSLRPPSFPPS